ncbi:o-succinylbenzoate synthase [Amnibacterium kyonggiense]|uniref:o-succinylbenzoate synthase n=1 Tax=Amnibacterium kyonggiense TaxID=595671 RepID=UPI001FE3D612|nr:o-succinylbenzoate synthase [Amnibacterium kyonggiense]
MLPDVDDLLGTMRVVALPLVTRFRGITVREAALFEGPEGWTEFAPFVEYDDAEASRWLAAAIDFGWEAPPAPLRDAIAVNATVPAVAPGEVASVLARFPGCRTAKVKVAEPGSAPDEDLARVRAVRDVLGPEGRIRVDANAAWNVDEAEHALRLLSTADLEYVEQPCATVDELIDLRRRTKDLRIPIAADESIRRSADPFRAGAAADVVIVKAAPLGGIRTALGLARMLSRPAVVSSALDTSVGLAMGAHLAAALPELPYDCGLGTAALLAADVVDEPLRPRDGTIPVGRVTPSPVLLDRWKADEDRTAWWADRVRRVRALLD